MQEGQKAIERSAAARGGLNSARTVKALQGYGQNLASQEYQNAYNRFNQNQSNQFNRLASLAGLGQTANQQLGNASMNYGNQMSNIYTGMGNATAAANIGQADRIAGLMGQGATAAAIFSDERLKTNVKPIPKEDINEFRSTIKPYFFNYINEDFGTGEWAGVMAQDLEKSKLGKMAIVEDHNGNKLINTKKLMSILLASQAMGV